MTKMGGDTSHTEPNPTKTTAKILYLQTVKMYGIFKP